MSYTVYLVEDERSLNHILTAYLEREGFTVKSFLNGEDAISELKQQPHLWVVDITLPDTDGFQLLKKIRQENELTPVIFISARDADIDRIIGLEMGSDDYLAKPFLPQELVLRTKKLLNRIYRNEKSDYIKYDRYVIDKTRRLVLENDTPVDLSSKEFELLSFFVHSMEQALSREVILNKVWEEGYFGSDRVVDDTVRRLRKKCEHLRIETIYGFGYRMLRAL